MKQIHIILIFFLVGIIAFSGCDGGDKSKNNPSINLEIVHFDKLLMEMDTSSMKKSFSDLQNKYPDFVDIYFTRALPIKGFETQSDSFFVNLKGFITDPSIVELYKMTQEVFGDFNNEANELSEAFGKMKDLFPDQKPPRIYTFISEFTYQRFIFEDFDKDGLAIGLDMFLGDKFDYIRLEQGQNMFSNYLTRTYDKTHIVKKVMEAWIEDYMGQQTGNRLIDHMMYHGKKLHLLKQLIPEANDSVIIEYTQEQMDWMSNNEEEMWTFYLKNELFYSTDQYKIKRLTFPAPNSTAIGMPSSAPGRTGNYLGLKIVESFVNRNPEMDFKKLQEMDAQRLLESSKYKPRKR